jgi:hypothetical protein
MMIRHMIRRRGIPSARPASSWPGSTDSSPLRMISTMYAASFSDSAIAAARNGVNQFSVKTCETCGSASQMKSSCSSVGVARNSHV